LLLIKDQGKDVDKKEEDFVMSAFETLEGYIAFNEKDAASPPPWGPGSPERLHKAPTDYTKPQQTIQIPDRLYKAPKRLYKAPKRLHKAPTDYTKPQQTIQIPDRLYKAQKRLYKAPTDFTKPQKTLQRHEILVTDIKCETLT